MLTVRSTMVALAMALAISTSATLVSAAAPAAPAASAPAVTGSVSGMVVDKDGKPAVGATISYLPVMAAPAGAPPAGGAGAPPGGGAPGAGGGRGAGGRGGRGGRGGGRGLGNATTDDKGAFTINDVGVGQVNIQARTTPTDGSTPQLGTTAAPVEVKEKATTKLTDPIKLADAPARGGRGGGRGGAGGPPPGGAPPAPPAGQ